MQHVVVVSLQVQAAALLDAALRCFGGCWRQRAELHIPLAAQHTTRSLEDQAIASWQRSLHGSTSAQHALDARRAAAWTDIGAAGLPLIHPFVATAAQVMPPFDIEMVEPLQERMRAKGVQLHLGDGVAGFEQTQDGGLNVLTQAGKKHAADLVMLVRGQGVCA
jgi:hypothetical protein